MVLRFAPVCHGVPSEANAAHGRDSAVLSWETRQTLTGDVFRPPGGISSLAALTAILAGVVLFPILLPWLPTHNFSTKGFLLGLLAALPFALSPFLRHPDWTWYHRLGQALEFLLAMPAVTAFIALNFTGSSTFTSRSGVKREMFAVSLSWPLL